MIQSVVRALRILEAIRYKGTEKGLGLVDIARELGLEKSTVYNLIKTLLAEGYVEQDGSGGKYRLGAKLIDLTHGGLGDKYLQNLLMPLCRELQQKTGENISLVAYRAGVVKIICRVLCDNELVVAPNNFKPLYTTITGRCLLAQLGSDQLLNIINVLGYPGELWNDIDDFDTFTGELLRIRESGMMILDSEKRQLGGVGYIIPADEKFTPLALGSAMPLFRFREKQDMLLKIFPEYSRKISALLNEAAK